MGDAGWKVRKEALEQLHGIVAANKRLKPTLGTELIPALKGRLGDSNKSLVMTTCEIIGMLAKAIEKPFEKHARVLLPPMISNLNDNKAPVRAAVTSALDSIAEGCSLACIFPAAGTALEADAPTLRKDMLKWLEEKLKANENLSPADVEPVIIGVLSCLPDRNADVRKNAQATTAQLVRVCGYDMVRGKCASLKGTASKTVMPIVEGLRTHDTGAAAKAAPAAAAAPAAPAKSGAAAPSGQASARSASPASDATSGSTRPPSPKGLARPSNLKSKLALKRKVTAQAGGPRGGSGLPAPGAASSGAAANDSGSSAPLLTSETRPKEIRADKDRGLGKWAFDAPRKDLIDALADQSQAHISPELHAKMFCTTHQKDKENLAAITMLNSCVAELESSESNFGISPDEMKQRIIANLDLIFKYLSIRLYDNGTTMLLKCVELIENLFNMLDEAGYRLTEYEAGVLLPHFVNKVSGLI
jgi:cytoskeleton-associated protein 5